MIKKSSGPQGASRSQKPIRSSGSGLFRALRSSGVVPLCGFLGASSRSELGLHGALGVRDFLGLLVTFG